MTFRGPAIAAAAAAVIAVAGCSAGRAAPAAPRAPADGGRSAAVSGAPGCSTRAAAAPNLSGVADSDRFSARGAASSLAVVSVPAALAARPALLGYLPAGGFPREMALEPGGRELLVTDFSSQQLQAIDVAGLP